MLLPPMLPTCGERAATDQGPTIGSLWQIRNISVHGVRSDALGDWHGGGPGVVYCHE